jgi:hypothetical protein
MVKGIITNVFFFFFWGQFCDVAKLVIIHRKDLAIFLLQAKYESNHFKTSFYIYLATLLEPCKEN